MTLTDIQDYMIHSSPEDDISLTGSTFVIGVTFVAAVGTITAILSMPFLLSHIR
jgi:hypothetical protein